MVTAWNDVKDYAAEADELAQCFVSERTEAIVTQLVEDEKIYVERLEETYADPNFDFVEAAKVMVDLPDYKETDRSIIGVDHSATDVFVNMAFFTYQNAVNAKYNELLKEIEDDWNSEDRDTYNGEGEPVDDNDELKNNQAREVISEYV